MIRLKYKLTEEDAVKYYEIYAASSRESRIAKIFAVLWFPALLVALLIALKLNRSLLWTGLAVFLSLIWAMFFAPRMFNDVVRTAAKRQLKEKGFVRESVEVIDDEGTIKVDGKAQRPVRYTAYYDLFVIGFQDGSTLIVPERAFAGDEKKMEQFMKDVVKACADQKAQ